MLDWMVWTLPVAVFFGCVALMLALMTAWELRSPTTTRKGWLPIATTRGDRLFIGLLLAAYLNLAWVGLADKAQALLGLAEEPSAWPGFLASMALLALVMRKG